MKKITLNLALIIVMIFTLLITTSCNGKEEYESFVYSVDVDGEELSYYNADLKYTKELIDDENVYINAETTIKFEDDSDFDPVSGAATQYELDINFDSICSLDNGHISVEVSCVDDNGQMHVDVLEGYVMDNGDIMLLTEDCEPIYLNEMDADQVGWLSRLCKSIKSAVSNVAKKVSNAIKTVINHVSDSIIAIGKKALYMISSTIYVPVVDKIKANSNYEYNKKLSMPSSYAFRGNYIERQTYFNSWKMGFKTLDYNGCGIIAMYNTLMSFGEIDTKNKTLELAKLIKQVEYNYGIVLCGVFGVNPKAITNTMNTRGYESTNYFNQNDFLKVVDKASVNSNFICFVLNNKNDLKSGMHYYYVKKVSSTEYEVYNNGDSSRCNINEIIKSNAVLMTGYKF